MLQIAENIKPDLLVFTMDGSIGNEAAFEQAHKFRATGCSGAIILTKMDGRANGGAVFSSIAAAKVPLIFFETGQRVKELENFEVKMFATHLVGIKDRIMELHTQDFHDVLLKAGACESEGKHMMEDLKKSCLDLCRKKLEEYKGLVNKISSLKKEYDANCSLLGEVKLKNTKIHAANSLEERYAMMLTSAKCLEDCRKERFQKLHSLQARAHDLCRFLGSNTTKKEDYQFFVKNSAISVQEVIDANDLSLEFIKRVEDQISEMEMLKSKKMAKIFKMKAAELDKELEAAPFLKSQKGYLPDFTLDDVEQGRIDFTFAVKKMEELLDKTIESHLLKKMMVSDAIGLLEKESASEKEIKDMIEKIGKWETQYKATLYDDEAKLNHLELEIKSAPPSAKPDESKEAVESEESVESEEPVEPVESEETDTETSSDPDCTKNDPDYVPSMSDSEAMKIEGPEYVSSSSDSDPGSSSSSDSVVSMNIEYEPSSNGSSPSSNGSSPSSSGSDGMKVD